MLEFLEKFNNLPADVKQKISSGAAMAAIEELEGKYGVDLAAFIMRVMIGELYYKNLTANLIIEFNLAPETASLLAGELETNIFASVMDYLNKARMAPGSAPAAPVISPSAKAGGKPGDAQVIPVVRRAPAVPSVNYLEEDKKDIVAMGKIASSLENLPQEKTELILAEVIKEANISFASDSLAKRLKDILLTYLRGIRAKVQVREILLKDIASGGVKMAEADADRVLGIAQKKLAADQEKLTISSGKVSAKSTAGGTSFIFNQDEIKQALAQREGKPANASLTADRDVAYDLSVLKNRSVSAKIDLSAKTSTAAVATDGQDIEKIGAQNFSSPVKKETPKMPDIDEAVSMTGIPMPEAPKKIIPPSAPEPENAETPNIILPQNDDAKRTAAVVGNKKRMEDIKPAPRTMSPIDELAYLDLVNFRRLDPSPAKRVAKIEEKINLLEKEGIDKKIEGIRVWRLNPVSKTYLAMGQESIGSGKKIEDIIRERKEQGLNYLTQEEFEAVMDLNNNLRF